jgi:uncharacterized membrane protein YeaQ/YmgE (transglycosylase-associated protein family)
MIGMGFLSFLWLLIIAVVVSVVLYYLIKIQLASGYWMQLIVSWIGAWLGGPVFGKWFASVQISGIYIIPAILGAIALTWFCRTREKACEHSHAAAP